MNHVIKKLALTSKLLAGLMLIALFSGTSHAAINGITGTTFNLTAKSAHITTPDGDSVLMWGYAPDTTGVMQYPGPTLIVNQGDEVTINLTSELSSPVSIVFPGQEGVVAAGGTDGLLTKESSGPADMVSYTFTATNAGTYIYHSGTNQDLQVEMGLLGALVVRPATDKQAYNHADTAYDYEYLYLLTEMDPAIHNKVEFGQPVDNTEYHSVLWFINGRNAPDTLSGDNVAWLPHQPYGSIARVRPGETALIRFVSAGRELHPFHMHGNHFRLIARDGRMLESAPGNGTDLSFEDYTLKTVPGATYDALWNWTGEKMGWDVFGTEQAHLDAGCNDANADDYDDVTREYCPDHGKPFPVVLPELQDMAFGGFYSGSPFLGAFGSLPPGEGGLNLNGGMFYMWHSHTEREIINNDIFPGGMLTMMIVESPGVPIE